MDALKHVKQRVSYINMGSVTTNIQNHAWGDMEQNRDIKNLNWRYC
jgi:hypothetical protein